MSGQVSVLARVMTAVVAVAVLVLAWTLQRRLIYLPAPGPVPSAGAVLPGGEEVSFDTEDGHRLRGWFVRGDAGAAAATVLVFNGAVLRSAGPDVVIGVGQAARASSVKAAGSRICGGASLASS